MPNTFLGITAGSKLYITNQLNINLVLWLDEAFLNAGMYRRVSGSGDGNYANTLLAELSPVTDKRYPSGTYWESRTNNWVWESGLAITAGFIQPFRPSGIYLREPGASTYTFYPSGTSNGNYNYKFNFKEGSVRFINENIVSSDSSLLCPHSYKEVHVDLTDSERFNKLVFSDTKEEILGSGTQFPTHRQVQLPAVFIEHIDRRWKPLALGGNKIALDAWQFHIWAENQVDRDQIMDMVGQLQGKSVKLADFNTAAFPLDDSGDINPAYPNLDTLQNTDFYRNASFLEVTTHNFKSLNGFYRGEVDALLEIYSFN